MKIVKSLNKSDKPVIRNPITKQGWKINRSREKLGITSKDFSLSIGIDKGHAHNLEYGPTFNPCFKTLKKICQTLSIDPKELL